MEQRWPLGEGEAVFFKGVAHGRLTMLSWVVPTQMYMGNTEQSPWFIFQKEKDKELGWEQSREVVVDPPEGREIEMNIYEYNQNSLYEILKDPSL